MSKSTREDIIAKINPVKLTQEQRRAQIDQRIGYIQDLVKPIRNHSITWISKYITTMVGVGSAKRIAQWCKLTELSNKMYWTSIDWRGILNGQSNKPKEFSSEGLTVVENLVESFIVLYKLLLDQKNHTSTKFIRNTVSDIEAIFKHLELCFK